MLQKLNLLRNWQKQTTHPKFNQFHSVWWSIDSLSHECICDQYVFSNKLIDCYQLKMHYWFSDGFNIWMWLGICSFSSHWSSSRTLLKSYQWCVYRFITCAHISPLSRPIHPMSDWITGTQWLVRRFQIVSFDNGQTTSHLHCVKLLYGIYLMASICSLSLETIKCCSLSANNENQLDIRPTMMRDYHEHNGGKTDRWPDIRMKYM